MKGSDIEVEANQQHKVRVSLDSLAPGEVDYDNSPVKIDLMAISFRSVSRYESKSPSARQNPESARRGSSKAAHIHGAASCTCSASKRSSRRVSDSPSASANIKCDSCRSSKRDLGSRQKQKDSSHRSGGSGRKRSGSG